MRRPRYVAKLHGERRKFRGPLFTSLHALTCSEGGGKRRLHDVVRGVAKLDCPPPP